MELYEVALQMLLERRDMERGINTIEGLGRTEKLLLLSDLAYWLIRNGYTDVDVPRALYRIAQRVNLMPQVKAGNKDLYQHLLERTGLIREPVEGRVDFIHRTFQEYLAARDAMNIDDVGTVVQNAHLDQWHEVVVMAVGHASQKQREELLSGLLKRGDLLLLVLASLETVPELSGTLRREIQMKTSRLLPPSSMGEAKAFASAGEYVLDLLADSNPQTINEITSTIRALGLTQLDEALPVLATFASDPRDRVFDELLNCMALFGEQDFGEIVLANASRPSLLVNDERRLIAARYMKLNQLILNYIGDHASLVPRLRVLPQVSVLRLHNWPEIRLGMIGTRFRVSELAIFDMRLENLNSLEFVESVSAIRFERCSLLSFEGVERWKDSLKQVSSVGHGPEFRELLGQLRRTMPHLIVVP